jgi:hypothetical protein
MKVCVVGTGFVGLTTGTCWATISHSVVCTGSDAGKISGLNRGKMPRVERHLSELVAQSVAAGRLRFVKDATPALLMDGRNLLERQAIERLGFEDHGVGRPSAKPGTAAQPAALSGMRDGPAHGTQVRAARIAELA